MFFYDRLGFGKSVKGLESSEFLLLRSVIEASAVWLWSVTTAGAGRLGIVLPPWPFSFYVFFCEWMLQPCLFHSMYNASKLGKLTISCVMCLHDGM
jgi:hypothetical protein